MNFHLPNYDLSIHYSNIFVRTIILFFDFGKSIFCNLSISFTKIDAKNEAILFTKLLVCLLAACWLATGFLVLIAKVIIRLQRVSKYIF